MRMVGDTLDETLSVVLDSSSDCIVVVSVASSGSPFVVVVCVGTLGALGALVAGFDLETTLVVVEQVVLLFDPIFGRAVSHFPYTCTSFSMSANVNPYVTTDAGSSHIC